MKIAVDLKDVGFCDNRMFESKEEYDQDIMSQAGYERRRSEPWPKTGGPIERYSHEPDRFPCIQVEAGMRYRHDGPDEMMVVYIYDYVVLED